MTVIERTNLRYLPGLPQKVDVVTLDLSFISILKVCLILFILFSDTMICMFYKHHSCEQVMPAVMNVMNDVATLVTLVKPQFEARRSQVNYEKSILYKSSPRFLQFVPQQLCFPWRLGGVVLWEILKYIRRYVCISL